PAPAVHDQTSPVALRDIIAHHRGLDSCRGLRNSRIRSPARRFTIVSMSTADTTTEPRADTPQGSAEGLPGCAPIPRPVLAPGLSDQGYYVGCVARRASRRRPGGRPPRPGVPGPGC